MALDTIEQSSATLNFVVAPICLEHLHDIVEGLYASAFNSEDCNSMKSNPCTGLDGP